MLVEGGWNWGAGSVTSNSSEIIFTSFNDFPGRRSSRMITFDDCRRNFRWGGWWVGLGWGVKGHCDSFQVIEERFKFVSTSYATK